MACLEIRDLILSSFIHFIIYKIWKVFQPSGWETGLDSSGVRTPTPLGLVSRGTKVTWTCPDSKRNIVDGKQSWIGECLESKFWKLDFVIKCFSSLLQILQHLDILCSSTVGQGPRGPSVSVHHVWTRVLWLGQTQLWPTPWDTCLGQGLETFLGLWSLFQCHLLETSPPGESRLLGTCRQVTGEFKLLQEQK